MSKLDDYVRSVYAADPSGSVSFANRQYRLVHVRQRRWRGYKVVPDALVRSGTVWLEKDDVTAARYKLIPDKMKDEFLLIERDIDSVISTYCVSGTGEDGDATPVITGGGNYAVLADNWSRVRGLLGKCQKAWSDAADRWCTEDGYEQLHELAKEKFGDDKYLLIKDMIPAREDLRGKFGLVVREVPVKIVEDDALGAEAADDRAHVLAELVAGSVRRPRAEAATAWRVLADLLVVPDGAGVKVRVAAPGSSARDRHANFKSILAARAALDSALVRCGPAMDSAFRAATAAVGAELPDKEDAAKRVASVLNNEGAAALRVGKILLVAADVAADEDSMCSAVAAAFAGG